MKAEDLSKEVELRTAVNTWIKNILIDKFVESKGQPVNISEHNARNPNHPLDHKGIEYMKVLGYKVEFTQENLHDDLGTHGSVASYLKISLPVKIPNRAQ